MFGYYWCVGDDKKSGLNCHKAIENQEGQDSAACKLCDGSKETGAGRGRASKPSREPQSLPIAWGKVWQSGIYSGLQNATCLATEIFQYTSQMENNHTELTLI